MLKHESGYIITDPEGLAEFHANCRNHKSKVLAEMPLSTMALVKRRKFITVEDKTSVTGHQFVESQDGVSYIWVMTLVERSPESWVYHDRSKSNAELMRGLTIGNKHFSGCWFGYEIIPAEFIKSPARIALEKMGAQLA